MTGLTSSEFCVNIDFYSKKTVLNSLIPLHIRHGYFNVDIQILNESVILMYSDLVYFWLGNNQTDRFFRYIIYNICRFQ